MNKQASKAFFKNFSAIGIIAAVLAAAPASAQAISSDDGTSEANAIVVTGARAENSIAIDSKRNNDIIADFLSSDEVGKLPDLNIAESLSRIPGVSAVFDEDRARFVTVRGLKSSLNYTALDGLAIATTDDFGGTGRNMNLEVIPSGAVGLLEVRKTFTPEVDGGAIGGYIDLHTRSAFGARHQGLVVQGGLNYSTYKDVPGAAAQWGSHSSPIGGQVDATYVTRFGAAEQFGLVLSGQFAQDSRDESKNVQASEAYYNSSGKAVNPLLDDGSLNPAWNGLTVPREVRSYDYTNRVRNYGGSAKLEYQGDTIYASIFGFYYGEDQQETRHMMQSFSMASPKNLTATSGDLTYGEIRTGWNSNTLDKINTGVIGNFKYDDHEGNRFQVVSGWSHAKFSDYQPLMDFTAKPANRSVHYDVTSTDPRTNSFTFQDVGAILDPKNYSLLRYNELSRLTTEDVYDTKVSYAHNRNPEDTGFGFEIGAEYRRLDRMRDNDQIDYVPGKSVLNGYAIQTDFQPSSVNFPLMWVDGPAYSTWAHDNLAVNEASTADQAVISDYRYIEDTMASYAMGQYRSDKFYLVAGLRYENVATKAIAPGEYLSDPFITRKGGYHKWLPSAGLSYELTDDLVVKAGFSKSLGRPNPGDIAQRERRNDVTYVISRGNANLQPRTSNNYDLSLEYYFPNRNGVLSVAVFRKDISNEIYTQSSTEMLDGVEYTITQPRNAQGSKVTGVELGAIVNSLEFIADPLKNLGFSANLTYTEGNISYLSSAGDFAKFGWLEDQARWVGNASVFYQFGKKAELRASYSYRGKYYDAIPTVAWSSTGLAPMGQLGAYFRYDLTDNVSLKFKARNILNANGRTLRGIGLDDLGQDTEYGQSFYFDVLMKF
ncbi:MULTISPECIES: TonB-dependent receptor [unclassified Novosphingobium]|uniref:TonB-dependent receptor n=1 Tax=unclassified Novosphingobium TaxID=2644732 RepID=UPI0013584126|nr:MULTISPECIES: TonB-dependent receptor [unclassified Novosphingobium]